MKTPTFRLLIVASLLMTLTFTSCAPCYPGYGYENWGGHYRAPYQADTTVGGALIGAAAGGIIGNQSGRGLEGAAIGGILGAIAGGGIQQGRGYGCAPRYGYSRPYGGHQSGRCLHVNQGYYDSGYYPNPGYAYPQPYSPYGW